MADRIFKVAWSIVADGTLFKGAFAVLADDEQHAIERAKSALGREASAANFTLKGAGEYALELGRSEYPCTDTPKMPSVSPSSLGFSSERFVFDVAARANVIAADEDAALKRFGHAISGKTVGSVKFLNTKVTNPEPVDAMSSFEKHLLEKQYRQIRVAST